MEGLGLFRQNPDSDIRIDRSIISGGQMDYCIGLSIDDKARVIDQFRNIEPEVVVNVLYDSWKYNYEEFSDLYLLSQFVNFKALTAAMSGLIVFGRIPQEDAEAFVREMFVVIRENECAFEDYVDIKKLDYQEYLICDLLKHVPEGESMLQGDRPVCSEILDPAVCRVLTEY